MKSKTTLAAIGMFVLAGSIISINAITPGCVAMCFDPVKNAATKGFDPQFLKSADVLATCQQSHKDLNAVGLPDLAYCSKSLGTL